MDASSTHGSSSPVTDSLVLFPVSGDCQPAHVETVRVLGHGRAAEARLVCVRDADGSSYQCVEKVFAPGRLTRLIYRLTYQAPFAYQDNVQAIAATFYRRRVAAAIVQAFAPDASVARPLYVRWDPEAQGMVLASEFIPGRGIIPAPADPFSIRRRLSARLRNRFPRLLGTAEETPPVPTAEIDQLRDVMQRLETLLVDCGLVGSGWQVCQRAIVSTANLLRIDDRYVVVDLESGIPSVLVPSYLWAGARMRAFPLFDDLDAARLRQWISQHETQLQSLLPHDTFNELMGDVERLIACDHAWKSSEPAIGRRPSRLLGGDFWQRYRQRLLDSWQRREITDCDHHQQLSDRRNLFTSPTYLAGLLPGRIGRFVQRCVSHQGFRQQVQAWLRDPAVRRQRRTQYMLRQQATWREQGRLPLDIAAFQLQRQVAGQRQAVEQRAVVSSPGMGGMAFVGHWLLAHGTPVGMHRWLTDGAYRSRQFTRLLLFTVSGRFQRDIGQLYIQSRLHAWQRETRLSPLEIAQLQRQVQHPAVEDYVRGFGMHLGLKLLSPLLASIKVGGAAASVASGNPLFFIASLTVGPLLRTAITAYRKLATGRPWSDYRQALLIGLVPTVGTLAFAVQIGNRFPQLSTFLMRDFAARLGRALPIYGGKDSRTELACIAAVDRLAEALDVWDRISGVRVPESESVAVTPRNSGVVSASQRSLAAEPGRWDRVARRELLLTARQWQLDPREVLVGPAVANPNQQAQSQRRAA